MKIFLNLYCLFSILLFTSCQKWLDVKPKTQIESKANFTDAKGFKDALTGVYINMTSASIYGKELSFGLTETLAKLYTQISSNDEEYYQAALYNYGNSSFVAKNEAIWKGNYFSIANINNILANLHFADTSLFDRYEYNVIKGESHALRAFHHFDLLRLYAPSPASATLNAPAIPYKKEYKIGISKQLTIKQILQEITYDLDTAYSLLKVSDPIVKGTAVPSTTVGYMRNRNMKFNYYAVLALTARVQLYAGNYEAAKSAAGEVISSGVFPKVTVSQISGGNRIFSPEVIFCLNINTLSTLVGAFYTNAINPTMTNEEWMSTFELSSGGSGDYRYLYQTELSDNVRMSNKLQATVNTNAIAANRLPLIRLSEMHYILAECLMQTNTTDAVVALNVARSNRNLAALSTNLNKSQIQDELIKEYKREFIGEGQLFYLYKRLNLDRIPNYQTPMSDAEYVFPIPDDEIEFGAIKSK